MLVVIFLNANLWPAAGRRELSNLHYLISIYLGRGCERKNYVGTKKGICLVDEGGRA